MKSSRKQNNIHAAKQFKLPKQEPTLACVKNYRPSKATSSFSFCSNQFRKAPVMTEVRRSVVVWPLIPFAVDSPFT
jgi:hypothetical protein